MGWRQGLELVAGDREGVGTAVELNGATAKRMVPQQNPNCKISLGLIEHTKRKEEKAPFLF